VFSGVGWANGPEVISTGPAVIPVQSVAVQLVTEDVRVTLPGIGDGRGGSVSCVYELRNLTDQPISFEMAFVTNDNQWFPGDREAVDSRFSVRQVDEELPVRVVAIDPTAWSTLVAGPPDSLPSWTVGIPAAAMTSLLISYQFWWRSTRGPSDGQHSLAFRYHARPAAAWAGNIRKARVTFMLPGINGYLRRCLLEESPCASGRISPPGYTTTKEGLVWEFFDWEPTVDFEVALYAG